MSHASVRAEPRPRPAAPEPGAASPRPVPAVLRQRFGRHPMDRKDPFETSGVSQRDFTVSGSYRLPPDASTSAQQLAEEIRAEIHASLVRGCVAGAQVEIVDFDDARVKGEPPRRFVVTRTRTARRTPVNVNAYFQPYGEHLFYSVRSYTVPTLDLPRLLRTLWVTFLVLVVLNGILGLLAMTAGLVGYGLGSTGFSMENAADVPARDASVWDGPVFPTGEVQGYPTEGIPGFPAEDGAGVSSEERRGRPVASGSLLRKVLALAPVLTGFGTMALFTLLVLGVVFRTFLKNLFSGDFPSIALRKQFPGELGVGSFDDDDVIAFFKTNLDLTLTAISDVLERHGIDTRALRTIIQNLQTINVNTGGGEIVGAVFGGTGNSASGAVQA